MHLLQVQVNVYPAYLGFALLHHIGTLHALYLLQTSLPPQDSVTGRESSDEAQASTRKVCCYPYHTMNHKYFKWYDLAGVPDSHYRQ